jgi:ATP/maltotriose-dependent transcriptional regulator MalT
MPREEADGNCAVSQPRCEIEKAILEEECERPGEVRYRGMLLCGPHAALLRLEDRQEALLYGVFRMDEWIEENGSSAVDEEFVGRIRREREGTVAALRLTRLQLRSARKALE